MCWGRWKMRTEAARDEGCQVPGPGLEHLDAVDERGQGEEEAEDDCCRQRRLVAVEGEGGVFVVGITGTHGGGRLRSSVGVFSGRGDCTKNRESMNESRKCS